MSPKPKNLTCGLVMPISEIDGCSAEHWIEVKDIIIESVKSIPNPKFNVKMVSEADDVGVIQKRIVQNLHTHEIVVCDVSCKNPNVMFELGMRLAFDKATIIVKDDATDYSFDTSIIEHITYPRDLRFHKIIDFKTRLSEKLLATYKEADSNPNYSPFLKNFGTFKVVSLSETEVTFDTMIIDTLSVIQADIASLKRQRNSSDLRTSAQEHNNIPDDFAFKLFTGIRKYQIKHDDIIPYKNLIGDPKLYDFLTEYIEAQKYFPRRTNFIKYVNNILSSIVIE